MNWRAPPPADHHGENLFLGASFGHFSTYGLPNLWFACGSPFTKTPKITQTTTTSQTATSKELSAGFAEIREAMKMTQPTGIRGANHKYHVGFRNARLKAEEHHEPRPASTLQAGAPPSGRDPPPFAHLFGKGPSCICLGRGQGQGVLACREGVPARGFLGLWRFGRGKTTTLLSKIREVPAGKIFSGGKEWL